MNDSASLRRYYPVQVVRVLNTNVMYIRNQCVPDNGIQSQRCAPLAVIYGSSLAAFVSLNIMLFGENVKKNSKKSRTSGLKKSKREIRKENQKENKKESGTLKYRRGKR